LFYHLKCGALGYSSWHLRLPFLAQAAAVERSFLTGGGSTLVKIRCGPRISNSGMPPNAAAVTDSHVDAPGKCVDAGIDLGLANLTMALKTSRIFARQPKTGQPISRAISK
jgi:hypothetical protein